MINNNKSVSCTGLYYLSYYKQFKGANVNVSLSFEINGV